MARIFAAHPDAIANTLEIAARCTFSLDDLAYEYPAEGNGEPPQVRLERLAQAGLKWRYPEGAPEKAKNLVARELTLIGKLNYAPYFLTVHDIVAFARSRGILRAPELPADGLLRPGPDRP
jgi:DNA polymerase III alpha subunit